MAEGSTIPRGMERHVLEHSDVKINTHSANNCVGEYCSIHRPSDHHMRAFPQHWRSDRALMERICPHGVGHPDPDHMSAAKLLFGKLAAESIGIHGCDGCCTVP